MYIYMYICISVHRYIRMYLHMYATVFMYRSYFSGDQVHKTKVEKYVCIFVDMWKFSPPQTRIWRCVHVCNFACIYIHDVCFVCV